MPLTNELLPHHPLVFFCHWVLRCQQEGVYFSCFFFLSQLDRQIGSYINNPVGNVGVSIIVRRDIAKLERKEIIQIMKQVMPNYEDRLVIHIFTYFIQTFKVETPDTDYVS